MQEIIDFYSGIKTDDIFHNFINILPEHRDRIKFVVAKKYYEINSRINDEEERLKARDWYYVKKNSIIKKGLYIPIPVCQDLTYTNGRHRSLILKELGTDYIPVFYVDVANGATRVPDIYGYKIDWNSLYDSKLVKVKDIIFDACSGQNKEDFISWIDKEKNDYAQYCEYRHRLDAGFTFKSFEDVMEYVKEKRESIDPIRVTIINNKKHIFSGCHRWVAAYLLGVENIPCLYRHENEE